MNQLRINQQTDREEVETIRFPSTAILGVSSADRYATNQQRFASPTSPFTVTLNVGQNVNGFFNRISVMDLNLPLYLPTISNRNNSIRLASTIGGVTTNFTLILNSGYYTLGTLAAELQRVIRQVPAVGNGFNGAGRTLFTVAVAPNGFSLLASSNVVGETFRFFPLNALGNSTSRGLYQMINWVSTNPPATTQLSGPTTLMSTQYIDIVCPQLTAVQKVKDGDTGIVKPSGLIARTPPYGPGLTSLQFGSSPFLFYREFATPKQIRWDPMLPIGQLQFQILDDAGVPYGSYGTERTISPAGVITFLPALDNDSSLGDWAMTLQLSEN